MEKRYNADAMSATIIRRLEEESAAGLADASARGRRRPRSGAERLAAAEKHRRGQTRTLSCGAPLIRRLRRENDARIRARVDATPMAADARK